jgi:hypothetical protein
VNAAHEQKDCERYAESTVIIRREPTSQEYIDNEVRGGEQALIRYGPESFCQPTFDETSPSDLAEHRDHGGKKIFQCLVTERYLAAASHRAVAKASTHTSLGRAT